MERKYKDTVDATGIRILANGTAGALLNGIAQGSGASERVGNLVNITSLHLRASCRNYGLSATEPWFVRVIILYWIQAGGVTTPPTASAFATASDPRTFTNLAYRSAFKVLVDKQVALLPASGGSEGGGDKSCLNLNINRFTQLQTIYGTTGSGASDIQTGQIWLCLLANQDGVASPPQPSSFKYWCRIRYTDN